MDKEKIISLFTSGTLQGGAENKTVLRDIVQTFPYFQLAQVLYARHLYDDNDTDVTSRLKLAAAYAPNRKAMYMLFRKPLANKQEAVPEIKISLPVKEEVKYNFVYTPKEEEKVIALKEETLAEQKAIPIKEEEKKPIKEKKVSPISETFLEREILSEVAIAQTESKVEEIPLMKEEKPLEHKEVVPIIKEAQKQAVAASELHSFGDWLKYCLM